MLAWLLGLAATGIELVEGRINTACKALSRAKDLPETRSTKQRLRYIQADLCKSSFSDADIVFANSIMYSSSMMKCIADTALGLKPGTKIVSSSWLPGQL